MTGIPLDAGLHAPRVRKLNIPTRLQELLWKDMTRSLPIRATWFGTMECGRTCSCGAKLTLLHVWTSCATHDLAPLLQTLRDRLPALPPAPPAGTHPWYPLLALRELENARRVGKKAAKELRRSQPKREWAIGSYLWLLWTNRMKEVHGEGYAPPWRPRWTPRPTCIGCANLVGPAHKKSLPASPTTQPKETCPQKQVLHRGGTATGPEPRPLGSGRRRKQPAPGPRAPTRNLLAGPRGT